MLIPRYICTWRWNRGAQGLFLRLQRRSEVVDLVAVDLAGVGVPLETVWQRPDQPLRLVEQTLTYVHVSLIVLGRSEVAVVFQILIKM